MDFTTLILLLILAATINPGFSGSHGLSILGPGDFLSVEDENDILVSPNKTFSCGFYKVGTNAYCFSIWFTNSADKTVVWMANRDKPVNGRQSRLTLHDPGNMFLTDADGLVIWSTDVASGSGVELRLLETGNLVLTNILSSNVLWQSFDFPTDTLLVSQALTKNTTLVSARSQGSYFSGFYNFKFDDSNILNLVYNGPQISSVYWPEQTSPVFYYGRIPFNSSRIAVLDKFGKFRSSDNLVFQASDYGLGPSRRLVLDYDGMLRMYSLDDLTGQWKISWLPGGLDACLVNGVCGEYGVCSYSPQITCTCPAGFVQTDPSDWSKGCSPLFNLTCNSEELDFTVLHHTDYYGYDLNTYAANTTFEACRNACLVDCRCKGFGYALDGQGQCFPKGILLNGYRMPSSRMILHIKVPKQMLTTLSKQEEVKAYDLKCSDAELVLADYNDNELDINRSQYVKYLIAFVASFAVIELVCVCLVWWFLFGKNDNDELANIGYVALVMDFKRFTYAELKKATKNFKQEIGKGGFGTVYKGVLDDERAVAVKRLEGIIQGESEFWAEVSIIGKINHRNLVKLCGFCSENDHKLLVYEYMENGSLDKLLFSETQNTLDWDRRFNIAIGTAQGLSYLHEECLEWILHCDVKPQNILLDNQFEPAVADFGMSKLFKENNDEGFSRVRGTRGYLAPEWMMNQRIDAKADVYSYGIVVLELLTGKCASSFLSDKTEHGEECNDLVEWVLRNVARNGIEVMVDQRLREEYYYKKEKIERMLKAALLCVGKDCVTRPAMSQVVELLLGYCNKSNQTTH